MDASFLRLEPVFIKNDTTLPWRNWIAQGFPKAEVTGSTPVGSTVEKPVNLLVWSLLIIG